MRRVRGRQLILDPLRKKYVLLTPEEWVRQHLVQYLLHEKAVPRSLMTVEMGFLYQDMRRRADLVVYDRNGHVLLIAECKAPDVRVHQDTFDQIGRYNKTIRARYLLITNGLDHYCFVVDHQAHTYHRLDDIPTYDALLEGGTA